MDMAHHPSDDHTYILDPESPTEMARLITFDHVITKTMGGVLSEQSLQAMETVDTVLDLACGPGGWVLDVAFTHPDIDVAGVDISETMIRYATARAQSQHLANASFEVMNINNPLNFSDAAFDLVNARFINGVLRKERWAPFVAECQRILRPGGILRLTEMVDVGVSSSASFEQMNAWLYQTMWRLGYGFSPDGRGLTITPMLPNLLRRAGYQAIQCKAHALDFSAETDDWINFYRNTEVGYAMARSLFVKMGVTTPEEVERTYQQMLIEMHAGDFCGMWHFVTVWGQKPYPAAN